MCGARCQTFVRTPQNTFARLPAGIPERCPGFSLPQCTGKLLLSAPQLPHTRFLLPRNQPAPSRCSTVGPFELPGEVTASGLLSGGRFFRSAFAIRFRAKDSPPARGWHGADEVVVLGLACGPIRVVSCFARNPRPGVQGLVDARACPITAEPVTLQVALAVGRNERGDEIVLRYRCDRYERASNSFCKIRRQSTLTLMGFEVVRQPLTRAERPWQPLRPSSGRRRPWSRRTRVAASFPP